MNRELTLEERLTTLAEPMLTFVARCEKGEVRSRKSYAAFIQALITAGIPIPGHPCCERDNDGDGNCRIYSAIGHLRK